MFKKSRFLAAFFGYFLLDGTRLLLLLDFSRCKYLQKNKVTQMNKILMIIIAILLPPLAVFLHKGAGKDLVINIVLCLIFYIPGILHALWLTNK